MKVQITDEKVLDIGFCYYPEERTTIAYVHDPDTGDEWKEYAVASKLDQFNRNIGRKLALSRVLQHMYPTDHDKLSDADNLENKKRRTMVWEALVKRGMKLNRKGKTNATKENN